MFFQFMLQLGCLPLFYFCCVFCFVLFLSPIKLIFAVIWGIKMILIHMLQLKVHPNVYIINYIYVDCIFM